MYVRLQVGQDVHFFVTQDDFPTGVGLPAMIAVNTEVFGVIKCAFVIPVGKLVSLYLF